MRHLQRKDGGTYESRVKTYFAACRSLKKKKLVAKSRKIHPTTVCSALLIDQTGLKMAA